MPTATRPKRGTITNHRVKLGASFVAAGGLKKGDTLGDKPAESALKPLLRRAKPEVVAQNI